MNPAESAKVELDDLIHLFFEDPSRLGQFEVVSAADLPEPSRSLLAHDHHMTVTVESHHGCPVDVQVFGVKDQGDFYSRKIALLKQSDHRIVQYGIVRINRTAMLPEVQAEIEARKTPLGRILINHNVLRQVKLVDLFRITAGLELATAFNVRPDTVCYGRTAMIYCDGAPAIELLEIVI